jgi:hypothetical protein
MDFHLLSPEYPGRVHSGNRRVSCYGQVHRSSQNYPRRTGRYPQDAHKFRIAVGHQDPLLMRTIKSVTWL